RPSEDKAFGNQIYDPRKTWTERQLVEIATAHKPLFRPGARWSYSNTGYILLGLIVERATGNPLGAELRRRVFVPLRLRTTSFDTRPRIAGRHAHGYTRFGKPPCRHQRRQPHPVRRGGCDRLDRRRSRSLLPRTHRGPPPAPRPAPGDADNGCGDRGPT